MKIRRLISLLCFLWIVITVQGQVKYVFYFIGDGMGVNQVNGTEMYRAALKGRVGTDPLLFTQFPGVGMVSTYSVTHPVTDSAAGGTALATGKKTYNGAIGVDMNKQALVSVAECAKTKGKKVGIATSVSIDHATPAAFYAHQPDRKMFYEIACDLPKAGFDFYAGSGFLSPNKTSDVKDGSNIYQVIEKAGYTVARGIEDFRKQVDKADKMILIQQEGKPDLSLSYAIDQHDDDLTLPEITQSAIQFLMKENNKEGFFLMVEGGKIDWACHSNDAATVFWEVEDFDRSIAVAYDFYKKHPQETLIVITADHETGGIVLGTKKYNLNLQALQYQKCSIEMLSNKISELRKMRKNEVSWDDIKALLSMEMGFWSKLSIDKEQEKLLYTVFETSFVKNKVKFEERLYSKTEPLAVCARKVMNQIAVLGWAGGTHSAGYVPVFAIGAGSEQFCGKLDNVDIPKKIRALIQ